MTVLANKLSSDDLYRDLLSTAQEGVWIFDPEGHTLFANEKLASMLATTVDELMQGSVFDYLDPAQHVLIREQINLRRHGVAGHVEYTLRRPDGRPLPVLANSNGMFDQTGAFTGILTMLSDLTEQKRVESLRNSLTRIQQAITATLDVDEIMQRVMAEAAASLGCDSASVILYEGGRWVIRQVLGFSRLLVGRTFREADMPHGMKALAEREPVAIGDLLADGGFSNEEVAQYATRALLVLPLYTQQENLGVVFLNYREPKESFDPSELSFARQLSLSVSLALANARLFSSERQQRLLVERLVRASPACIAVFDGDLNLKFANETYLDYFRGSTAGRGRERQHEKALPDGPQGDELAARMRHVAGTGVGESEAEWAYPGAAGQMTFWRWTLTPLPAQDEGGPDLLLQLIDVTEQVTARHALENLAGELQQQAEELEIQTEELHAQNEELIFVTGQLADERARLEDRVRGRTAQLAAANAALQDEIAERKRAEEQARAQAERMSALAELSEALAEAGSNFKTVLDVAVRRTADTIGDACVVALVAEDGSTVTPVAFAHPRRSAAALMRRLFASNPVQSGEGAARRVAQTGQPVMVPRLDPEQVRASLLPEYGQYYDEIGIDSVLVVPLRARDRVIGTLGLTRDRGGQPYTDEDLAFVQSLADRAALAIANARLYADLEDANKKLAGEVAEREAAEASLARQAAELGRTATRLREQAELLNLTNDAVIARDMQANIKYWNRGAEKQYGWTDREVLGRRSHDLFETEFPIPIEEVYAQLLSRGRWEGELTHVRRDRSRIVVAARWALQRDGEGNPIGVLEINNDITGQKEAQARLAYQARLLENVTDAVVATDSDTRITLWNHGAEELFGLRAEDALGLRMRDAIEYEAVDPGPSETEKMLMTQGRYRGEIHFRCPDGREVITETSGLVLRDDEGRRTGYLGVNRDITARRRAEESLRQSLDALQRQTRRLALLRQIDRAVLAAQSVDRIAQVATEEMRHVLGCQRAALMLFDFERQAAVALAISTDTASPLEVGEPMPLAFYGLTPELHQGTSQRVADLCTLADPTPREQLLASIGMHSLLAVPLLVEGRLIGSLNLSSHEVNAFSQEDEDLARQVGDSLAVALQNARLYEREQRARQAAEALRAANIALSGSLDLEVTLERLLDVLDRCVPYDRAQVLLLEEPYRATIRAERHKSQDAGDPASSVGVGTIIDVESCAPLQAAIEESKTTLIDDVSRADDWGCLVGLPSNISWLGVPFMAGRSVLGVISLARSVPASFSREDVSLAEGIAAQAGLAIQNSQFFTQVEAGRRDLQALSRRLLDVQENERRAIARELHDEAGQSLTSLMLGLGLIEKESDQPGAVIERARQMKALTNSTLEALHRLAANLRPASLDRLGLVPALEQYIEMYRRQHEIKVEMAAYGFEDKSGEPGDRARVPADVQTALYRVVQEALTNIARHAGASHVGIILKRDENRVNLVIEDDGSGFDVEVARKRNRLGLLGMQERAEALGGTFAIESMRGSGTTVFIELPLVEPEDAGRA